MPLAEFTTEITGSGGTNITAAAILSNDKVVVTWLDTPRRCIFMTLFHKRYADPDASRLERAMFVVGIHSRDGGVPVFTISSVF